MFAHIVGVLYVGVVVFAVEKPQSVSVCRRVLPIARPFTIIIWRRSSSFSREFAATPKYSCDVVAHNFVTVEATGEHAAGLCEQVADALFCFHTRINPLIYCWSILQMNWWMADILWDVTTPVCNFVNERCGSYSRKCACTVRKTEQKRQNLSMAVENNLWRSIDDSQKFLAAAWINCIFLRLGCYFSLAVPSNNH